MSLGMTEKEMLCGLQLLHCCHFWIPHFSSRLNLPRLFSESKKWYLIMFYYIRKMTIQGNSFDLIHASKTSECKQNPVRDQCKVKSSSSLGWSLTSLSYDMMIWERIKWQEDFRTQVDSESQTRLHLPPYNASCYFADAYPWMNSASPHNLWNRHLSLI